MSSRAHHTEEVEESHQETCLEVKSNGVCKGKSAGRRSSV